MLYTKVYNIFLSLVFETDFSFPVKEDFLCDVCEDGLEVLENIIKENRTLVVIKAGLDKLCTFVSADKRSKASNTSIKILKILLISLPH